jgi:hypothetical protein
MNTLHHLLSFFIISAQTGTLAFAETPLETGTLTYLEGDRPRKI